MSDEINVDRSNMFIIQQQKSSILPTCRQIPSDLQHVRLFNKLSRSPSSHYEEDLFSLTQHNQILVLQKLLGLI